MRNILTKGQKASGLKATVSQCSLTTCCLATQLPSVANSKQCSQRGNKERGHIFLQKPESMWGQGLSWHHFMERQLWSPASAHLRGGSSGESLKARLETLVGTLACGLLPRLCSLWVGPLLPLPCFVGSRKK